MKIVTDIIREQDEQMEDMRNRAITDIQRVTSSFKEDAERVEEQVLQTFTDMREQITEDTPARGERRDVMARESARNIMPRPGGQRAPWRPREPRERIRGQLLRLDQEVLRPPVDAEPQRGSR
eukprot:7449867-Karenia_brevis.AAC.1